MRDAAPQTSNLGVRGANFFRRAKKSIIYGYLPIRIKPVSAMCPQAMEVGSRLPRVAAATLGLPLYRYSEEGLECLALSRRKQGFESLRERQSITHHF